jgi:hypothetical protein
MADIVYIEQGYYIGDNYFTRTADAAATLNTTATVSCTITNVKTFACDFQTLFTPTLSATILKNHTAVLDCTVTLLATISKTVANQSTLNNIVTLSLQGDRGRTFDSTLPASFTQSTQIQKILNASSTLNTQFTINVDGNVLGAAIEASATLNTTFTQTVDIVRTRNTAVTLNTAVTHSVTAQRFRGTEKTFIGEVTIFTEIGLLQNATCDFLTLFSPAVTCVALKNHTAVLDAVSSLSCAITKTTGYVVSVNLDSTVSVTVDRIRPVSATLNTEFNQTVTTIKTVVAASTFNIQFTQSTQVQKIKNAQSNISSQSSLTVTFITFVSKWYGTPRPITWTRNSDSLVTFDSGIKQSNNYSLKLTSTKTTSSGTYGSAYTSGALGYISGDFLIEFWLYLDNDSSMFTVGAFGDQLPMLLWGASSTSSIRTSVDGLTGGEEWGIGFDGQPGNAGGPPSSAGGRNIVAYAKTSSGIINVTQSSTNLANSIIRSNTWYHVAFGRQSNVYKIYINGTLRSSDTTSYSGSLYFGRPTLINSSGVNKDNTSTYKGPLWIDGLSIRVGDFTRTGYSNNGLATNDYDYTFVLSDFENNFNDTLSLSLSGSATLTASFTQSATAGKTITAQATLNTQFTVSAQIGEIEPADISMNTVSTLSTVVTRIKTLASSLNSAVSQSVNISKITRYTATISSAVTLSNIITRIKTFQTQFTVIATELAAIAKIGQGLITMDVVAQITAVINRTAAAESNLNTQFGITTQGDRTRFADSSFSVISSLNAVNSRIRAQNSTLNVEFAVTASNSRIRSTNATFNTIFALTAEPLPIKQLLADLNSNFGISSVLTITKTIAQQFNCVSTFTVSGIKAVESVSALLTEFALSTQNSRTRSFITQFNSIATELAAIAKIGQGLISMVNVTTFNSTPVKTVSVTNNQTRRVAKTITLSGQTQVSAAQSKFGGAAILMDGVDDAIKITPTTDFQFGLSAFTVEAWVRPTGNTTFAIWDARQSNFGTTELLISGSYQPSTNNFGISLTYDGTTIISAINTPKFEKNTWTHIACQKDSGQLPRIYVNGSVYPAATQSDTGSGIGTLGLISIGDFAPGIINDSLTGYIDEIRVSTGIRYATTGFTPIEVPFESDANTLLLIHGDVTITDDVGPNTTSNPTVAQIAIIYTNIKQNSIDLAATANITANGVSNKDVVINATATVTQSTQAVKTARISSNMSTQGGFVMSISLTKKGTIPMNVVSQLTVSSKRFRSITQQFNSSFTLNILAGKAAVAQCAMSATVTQTITAGILQLEDIIYTIPSETRIYTITTENRGYIIRNELRLYTVEG